MKRSFLLASPLALALGAPLAAQDAPCCVSAALQKIFGSQKAAPVALRELADRGYLGVRLNVGPDGLTIDSVMDGGGAAEAGLQAGDRLIEIADQEIAGSDGVPAFLAELEAGETVPVVYEREGRKHTAQVRLATLEEIQGTGEAEEEEVAEVAEVEEEVVEQHSAHDESQRGYLGIRMSVGDGAMTVLEVMPGTGAEKAGLRSGDRILRIGRLSPGEGAFSSELARMRAGDVVGVVYERGGVERETEVRLATLEAVESGSDEERTLGLRKVESVPEVEWFEVEDVEDVHEVDESAEAEAPDFWVSADDGETIEVHSGKGKDGRLRIRINGKEIDLGELDGALDHAIRIEGGVDLDVDVEGLETLGRDIEARVQKHLGESPVIVERKGHIVIKTVEDGKETVREYEIDGDGGEGNVFFLHAPHGDEHEDVHENVRVFRTGKDGGNGFVLKVGDGDVMKWVDDGGKEPHVLRLRTEAGDQPEKQKAKQKESAAPEGSIEALQKQIEMLREQIQELEKELQRLSRRAV